MQPAIQPHKRTALPDPTLVTRPRNKGLLIPGPMHSASIISTLGRRTVVAVTAPPFPFHLCRSNSSPKQSRPRPRPPPTHDRTTYTHTRIQPPFITTTYIPCVHTAWGTGGFYLDLSREVN